MYLLYMTFSPGYLERRGVFGERETKSKRKPSSLHAVGTHEHVQHVHTLKRRRNHVSRGRSDVVKRTANKNHKNSFGTGDIQRAVKMNKMSGRGLLAMASNSTSLLT